MLIVEVNAAELPIMDGSAAPFVFPHSIRWDIGTRSAEKVFARVENDKTRRGAISLWSCAPTKGFKLSYTLEYDHPVFAAHEHTAAVDFSSMSFLKEVCQSENVWVFGGY